MKFSVLMSVYRKDSPEHLKLALRSIYEDQTKKPDEITVVFDGPLTDELTAVLDEFREGKEEIVRYYPQEVNRGLGAALRIGAEKCTGDYLFRMDSDDVSAPTRFEKQAAFLQEHPDIDVLGTATQEFMQSLDESMMVCSFPAEHEGIYRLAKKRNPINHMSVCMKRESLIRCGSYMPLLLVEDYYLWLRMMVNGCKFANLEEPLVYVRVGNGFYNRRSAKSQIRSWKEIQNYMLKAKMIGRVRWLINMLTVRIFVLIPPNTKKWVYSHLLRKKEKQDERK